jgi:acyl dehydratase
MQYRSLYWEDVQEGQALPPITYELSLLRLVALVRAAGLYDYVHFDRDYAQAVGARDVFISTPHVAGLFCRLLTDWSGPEADLRSLTLRLNTQCCANDMLTISGKVGRKYVSEHGEHLIDLVDLNIAHALAPSADSGSATMAFPSKESGPLEVSRRPQVEQKYEMDPNAPDFARTLVGQVKDGAPEPARPLSKDEIHLWCECLEDWNPLYWDKDFASKSRYGGIIAPPPALFFGAGSAAHLGVGYMKPGEKIPDAVRKGLTGLPLLKALRANLVASAMPVSLPEFPEVAVAEARYDFYTALRPGDSMHTKLSVLNCSAKKRTKLGEGHFVTWISSMSNPRQELIRTFTVTALLYRTV